MNRSILASRTKKAIEAIAAETARLGGEFAPPAVRHNDAEHRQMFMLEAVAEALQAVPTPAAAEAKSAKSGKGKVNDGAGKVPG